MMWRFRLSSAVLAVLLVLLPSVPLLLPGSTLEWGITVLAVGFLALVLGVAINWRLRHGSGITCPAPRHG